MINLAWLAGFLDGDGCVGVYRVRTHLANNVTSEHFFLQLSFAQKSPQALRSIQKKFGGFMSFKRSDQRRAVKNGSGAWTLNFSHQQAFFLLKKIGPYVVIKEKEVKNALKFQSIKAKQGQARNRAREERFYLRDRALKKARLARNA
jgi:hypothetical protein